MDKIIFPKQFQDDRIAGTFKDMIDQAVKRGQVTEEQFREAEKRAQLEVTIDKKMELLSARDKLTKEFQRAQQLIRERKLEEADQLIQNLINGVRSIVSGTDES